jgi:hypothetical protein
LKSNLKSSKAQLLEACDECTSDDEYTLVPRSGVADWLRWSRDRARPWRHGERPSPGTGAGVQGSLKRAHGHTLLCRTKGCGALVDLQSARAAANAAGRAFIKARDGCASAICSTSFCAGRFADTQLRMAEWLLSGERVLVLWPPTAAPAVDLWALPRARVLAKAHAVLSQFGLGVTSPAPATSLPIATAATSPLPLTLATDAPLPALATGVQPSSLPSTLATNVPLPAVATDALPPSSSLSLATDALLPALAAATSPPSPTFTAATSPPSPTLAAARSPPSPTVTSATSPPSLALAAATSPPSPNVVAIGCRLSGSSSAHTCCICH